MSRPESNGEFAKRIIDERKTSLTEAERELRNIYAGLALPALINVAPQKIPPEMIANEAFALADAMLERSRK